ncbi:MAG: VWA domain-containing protein [Terriglobia bacterium]
MTGLVRWMFFITLVILSALIPAVSAQTSTPDPSITALALPGQNIGSHTIAAGERLALLLETDLNSSTTRAGDPFTLRTTGDFMVGNQVAIPDGTQVNGTVTRVVRGGKLAGKALIQLHFRDLCLADGTVLPFRATLLRAGFTQIAGGKGEEVTLKGERGSGGNMSAVGQGAIQGALLGVMMGGGKGAAIGGASGAAVGLASVMLRRGPELDLPRDMLFEVVLKESLSIPKAASAQSLKIARTGANPPVISTQSQPAPGNESRPMEAPEPVPDFTKETAPSPDATAMAEEAKLDVPPRPLPGPPSQAPVLENEEAAPSDYQLRIDVQLVMVDAIVRDAAGQPIDHLKREDFRLLEDGIEQKIQTFSRDELPLAVALVVDRSGSVAPYMNELRRAAYRALSQLKTGDQVCLFTFDSEVQRLEGLTSDRQRIADRIAMIQAGGGTNIVDALFDAVYYLNAVARDRRRVVILVSDNEATTKPRSNQNQLIRMAMETETVVYSVKTEGEETPVTMRVPLWLSGNGSVPKIVHETGGEIIDVRAVGSLDAALAAVVTRLKLRYTLGYQPSGPVSSASFHKIDVQLSGRFGTPEVNYRINARRGYYTSETATAGKNP